MEFYIRIKIDDPFLIAIYLLYGYKFAMRNNKIKVFIIIIFFNSKFKYIILQKYVYLIYVCIYSSNLFKHLNIHGNYNIKIYYVQKKGKKGKNRNTEKVPANV